MLPFLSTDKSAYRWFSSLSCSFAFFYVVEGEKHRAQGTRRVRKFLLTANDYCRSLFFSTNNSSWIRTEEKTHRRIKKEKREKYVGLSYMLLFLLFTHIYRRKRPTKISSLCRIVVVGFFFLRSYLCVGCLLSIVMLRIQWKRVCNRAEKWDSVISFDHLLLLVGGADRVVVEYLMHMKTSSIELRWIRA